MKTRIVRAALLPLFLFAAGPLFAASNDIFVAGVSSTAVRATTTVTLSHTIASGANRYLLVGVSISNTASVSSVTYGGVGLTRIGTQATTGSNERVEMWQRIAPAVGTANVVVTLTANCDVIVGAISFINVNQTTPHRGFVSNSGAGTNATLTVPTFDRDMVVDTVVAAGGAGTLTASAYQVEWWNLFTGNGAVDAGGAGSIQPGSYGSATASAGTVYEDWTLNKSRRWAIGAVSLIPDVFPTAVSALQGSVTRCGDATEVRWTSERETGNLGFHVIREDERGQMTLTPAMIAGSFFTTSTRNLRQGRSYRWIDRDASRAARYWIEDIDANGRTTLHGPLSEQQGPCESAAAPPSQTIAELVRPSRARQVASAAAQTSASAPSLNAQYAIASAHAVKIAVDREGWYRVPRASLVAAGLDPAIDTDKLQLYAGGVEQSIIANADGIEFYGTGQDTTWTASRVYWLVAGNGRGKRVERVDVPAGGAATARNFPYAVERHDRNIYGGEIGNGEADNFFGPIVSSSAIATQTLVLPHVDTTASENATLTIAIHGVRGEHVIDVAINGHAAGTLTFATRDRVVRTLTIPSSWLVSGENSVTMSVASSEDLSAVESVRIVYPHTYDADGDALAFSANGGEAVAISGLASDARVFDTTDLDAIRELSTSAFVAPGSGTRTFFATAAPLAPLAVFANTPSSWNEKQHEAAVVILTTRALAPSFEPLRARRAAQFGSAEIVDVEDLYDEFNFGAKSPFAIRDFVRASRQWKTPPRYFILAGDASFDPRGYLGLGDFDFVPTKIVGTSLLETASDDWFTDLDGDGAADIPIGRIAVRNANDAAAYVAKIIAYETQPVGAWTRNALIVSDVDSEYDFAAMGDAIATTLAPAYNVTRATTREATLSALHEGAGVGVYFGHGSVQQWSEQKLVTNGDVPQLANGTHLPFVIAMTCLNAFFQDVYTTSLGEALLQSSNGGAIAMWTSSGLTIPLDQVGAANALARTLVTTTTTLGDAIVAAKKTISDEDVKKTWVLLGDPSMRLLRESQPSTPRRRSVR